MLASRTGLWDTTTSDRAMPARTRSWFPGVAWRHLASWVLAKHNRPFTDAEVFKEVMVTVVEELVTDKSMDALQQGLVGARVVAHTHEDLVGLVLAQEAQGVHLGRKRVETFRK
ncbi:hypothetical protein F7725_002912 [Dissostichus mawsoni]|uniref:Uncharacterized protein n=1 Tax=Dissostichus mawsoni TaxID=36200 RepID=A0A7J5Y8R1_DISMA|nr:hypothetical protein F7725_002912 [Dissostichus mawsoni]